MLFVISNGAYGQAEKGLLSINPHIGGYIFDNDQDIKSDPVYGIDIGYNITDHLGVEGSVDFIETETEGSPTDIPARASIYRVGGLYHFPLEEGVVPYIAVGTGLINLNIDRDDDGNDFLVNYGAGLKFLVTDRLGMRADLRHIIALDDTDNNVMYTVGLTYLFGKKEQLPPPPRDSDGDGVTDDLDKCPGTPAGVAVDADGCPKDSDGDGVPDYLDKCPDTPAGVAVDSDGCPKDSDGDGVPDYLDKCPDTPAGVAVDSDGCPKDSDGDGVPDYLDKCPDTPAGVAVDATGCPVVIEKEPIALNSIYFEFDRATLTQEAVETLNSNMRIIRENPEINVRIEGHSCAHGPDDYNLRLSERRANAIKEYFVNEGGIAEQRLRTIAYGETRLAMPEVPTPSNKNASEARANRRAQFTVIMY
ncbi:MAG: hypothetical protein AMK71_05950 [Nitrospira bacterium SG8_35_4]|nr:MAG: hypothetical protein AMK71_05950 [Nitrospira bacterium SG8_35_4]